ncbi:MAG TPA: TatD family hydrolase [Clostridiales bacterium]|nr:TatD family hydrolase [Clostridiales bacterium]
MLFDTHAHYDDERFDEDRYELLEKIHREGVSYILNAASDIDSAKMSIMLAEKYDFVYAAAGVHPHNAGKTDDSTMASLKSLISCNKVVAIGEIGLDYYYDFTPADTQKKWFAEQIRLAKRVKLPIIIHNRDSHEDVMRIIKEENARDAGGVFHCYSGSVEMARDVLNNNFYISFGGPVTFKNSKKVLDVLRFVPEDRILVETDCPYLTPEPFRGKRNHSGYLEYIVKKIAEIKGSTFEKMAELTMENGKRLFNIK